MIPGLLFLIIYTIVVGLIVWLCWYLADVTRVPAPFNRLIKMVAVMLAILAVIAGLLQLIGQVKAVPVP
jgi:hypothetical protein